MAKLAIVSDNNSGIDYWGENPGIHVLRSVINFGEKQYIDGVDITADEFYSRLAKEPDIIPSTGAPSLGSIYDLLDDLIAKGYTDVLYYPISYCLSSTGSSVNALVKEYEGRINIYSISTKAAGCVQLNLALIAKKMCDAGCSVNEILDYTDYLIKRQHTFLIVKDLRYFIKNGRLSGVSGFLGALFKIKPLLHINELGKIVMFERIRTFGRAVRRALDVMKEEIGSQEELAEISIFYTVNDGEVEKIQVLIKELFPKIAAVKICRATPSVGAHLGCGGIGIGYHIHKKNYRF